jgi:hypothetical protein
MHPPRVPHFVSICYDAEQRNLTNNAIALRLHRKGRFTDAIAVYDDVIASERDLCRSDASGSRALDERFLMNRGDAYTACGAVRKVGAVGLAPLPPPPQFVGPHARMGGPGAHGGRHWRSTARPWRRPQGPCAPL